MAITLNNKTKLTSASEKLFVQAGGYDPDKTLTQDELSSALKETINQLAEIKSPLLIKLYQQCVETGLLKRDSDVDVLSASLID